MLSLRLHVFGSSRLHRALLLDESGGCSRGRVPCKIEYQGERACWAYLYAMC
jgi:hypothetical protein